MRKILITGGAGFVGAALAKALAAQGHTVHLMDKEGAKSTDAFLTQLLASDGVELHRYNMLEPGALANLSDDYTHIVHFAAILGVEKVLQHPYATLRDNALLLELALAFAKRNRSLERFVFASTSEVYAGSLEQGEMPIPTPEDTPLALPALARPRTSYLLSKIYGEAMVQHAGVCFTIIRPHNLYGPRMGRSHVIPQLMEKAYRGSSGGRLEVFSVDHSRAFCFIDDAVEMILRVATLPSCEGRVLNVGDQSRELPIGELAELILEIVGKDMTIAARPATPGSPPRRCPEMSRMTELTGYRAQVPLEEGLRRTYDWYRRCVFERPEAPIET